MKVVTRQAQLTVRVVDCIEANDVRTLELYIDGNLIFFERNANSDSWGRLVRNFGAYVKEKAQ